MLFSLVHSKPLQLKMAKYCEEVFGDLLLGKPMESNPVKRNNFRRQEANHHFVLLLFYVCFNRLAKP